MKRITVGDVVLIEGSDGEHIVAEIVWRDGDVCVATNRSAWHDEKECTLVREADGDSFYQLKKDLAEEDEEWL